MIYLDRITDINLISARSYGIQIEIESLCDRLAEMDRGERWPRWSAAMQSTLEQDEATLRDVVVHAWPMPCDPVVLALRALAYAGLDCLDRVKRRVRDAAPGVHRPDRERQRGILRKIKVPSRLAAASMTTCSKRHWIGPEPGPFTAVALVITTAPASWCR